MEAGLARVALDEEGVVHLPHPPAGLARDRPVLAGELRVPRQHDRRRPTRAAGGRTARPARRATASPRAWPGRSSAVRSRAGRVNTSLHAGPWTFIRWVIDRSRQTLSIARASRGRCSQSWMPGTGVAIGRNSPRISAGASGFMSQRSMWLGPPKRKKKTHEFCRYLTAGDTRIGQGSEAFETARGEPQGGEPSDPQELATCRADRRDSGPSPRIESTAPPPSTSPTIPWRVPWPASTGPLRGVAAQRKGGHRTGRCPPTALDACVARQRHLPRRLLPAWLVLFSGSSLGMTRFATR